jgi:hypothetical protein
VDESSEEEKKLNRFGLKRFGLALSLGDEGMPLAPGIEKLPPCGELTSSETPVGWLA